MRAGHNIAKWARRILGALLILFVVVVSVLAIRLSQGPIAIDRFKPAIEAALQPGDQSFRIAIERAEIAWEGWREGVRVKAVGLRVARPDATVLAQLPSVTLRVGVGALMRGEVALKEMTLLKPELRLLRRADGRIELGLRQPEKSAGPMLPNLLWALARDRSEHAGGPLRDLETVSIVDGDLIVDDANLGREWQAKQVNGELTRDADGITASIRFQLLVDGRMVEFATRAHHRRADGTIRLGLEFKALSPKLFASARGALRGLTWFDTPFDGQIALDARDSGQIEGARFDLHGTRGSLTIPGYYSTPLVIAEFSLSGSLSEKGRRLDITKFDIKTAGPKLSTAGVFVGDEEEWQYNGTFTLGSFPAADIRKYWPEGLKPYARQWVTTNITGGTVQQVDLRIGLHKRPHPTEPLLLDEVKGAFRYSGLSVRFMEHLPPITRVDGAATFDDRDLKFTVARGEVEGVKLAGGKVDILGFDKPNEDFVIIAPIEGKIPDILRVLNRKPLGFAAALGVDPLAVGGDARATIEVRFPLSADVRLEQVNIRATADLGRVAWKKGLFGLDLADGRLKLNVDKSGMILAGEGQLGEESATLRWSETFAKTAAVRRTLDLKTRFNVDSLAAAGFDLRQHLKGAFEAELKITGSDDGRTQIDGVYDLADAAFTMPGLPISKPRGTKAVGRSLIVMANQRVIAVPRFSIESAALTATGSAAFHPDGIMIRTMDLTQLIAGRTDLRASIQGDRDGRKQVRIEGKALDISPLLANRSESGDVLLPPLKASARLERLYVGPDRFVTDLAGEAAYDGQIWRGIAIDAKVAERTPLTLRLVESGNGRVLQITTEDAGAALKALNIADTVKGGTLAIRATIDDRDPKSAFVGSVEMHQYRITRAPVMARLIAMASLAGIANLLASDEGVEFGTLSLPFRFRHGVVEVTDGHAQGSQIGITVSGRLDTRSDVADLRGTIVPLYLLNSMVGKIPLLGDVIVGEKRSGLFAARYTVSGELSRPNVSVNPLSMFTPGPFRKLFDGPVAEREGGMPAVRHDGPTPDPAGPAAPGRGEPVQRLEGR